MSKWIDAEWIRNIYADFEHYENRDDWTTPITNVLAVIDDAPSIDIVRCKECKHWSQAPKTERGWCDKCDGLLEPTFFCADGKPIVRCKDCKHYDSFLGCQRTKEFEPTNDCDYCSYGEREGE